MVDFHRDDCLDAEQVKQKLAAAAHAIIADPEKTFQLVFSVEGIRKECWSYSTIQRVANVAVKSGWYGLESMLKDRQQFLPADEDNEPIRICSGTNIPDEEKMDIRKKSTAEFRNHISNGEVVYYGEGDIVDVVTEFQEVQMEAHDMKETKIVFLLIINNA